MDKYSYLYYDFSLDDKKVYKGHKLYGLRCTVDNDGYFDKFHETGVFRKIGERKDIKYSEYRLKKAIKNITKSTGSGPDLKCYVNRNNIKDYYIVILSKENSKVEKAIQQLGFKVMKTPQE